MNSASTAHLERRRLMRGCGVAPHGLDGGTGWLGSVVEDAIAGRNRSGAVFWPSPMSLPARHKTRCRACVRGPILTRLCYDSPAVGARLLVSAGSPSRTQQGAV